MKYMIDTNIILDVLLEREPFYSDSKAVLNLCEQRQIDGYISASSATDIFYLIRKYLNSSDAAYEALGHVLNIVRVLTVTNDDVNEAYLCRASDFEDCLLAVCALNNGCDGVITRNKKDFLSFHVSIYSPEEIVAIHEHS